MVKVKLAMGKLNIGRFKTRGEVNIRGEVKTMNIKSLGG